MTLDDFDASVSPLILRRGRDYWMERRVRELDESTDDYHAFEVRGTSDYTVAVELDGSEIVDIGCTCPYNGGVCKHEVACLYHLREAQNQGGHDAQPVCRPDDMPSGKLAYLCYLAYSGLKSDGMMVGLPVIQGIGHASYSVQQRYNNELESEGWLERERFYVRSSWYYGREESYTWTVPSYRWLEALKILYGTHPEWLRKFSIAEGSRSGIEAVAMREVAQFVLGQAGSIRMDVLQRSYNHNLSQRFVRALWPFLCESGHAASVPAKIACRVVETMAEGFRDDCDVAGLQTAYRIAGEIAEGPDLSEKLHAALRRDIYYYTGTLPPATASDSRWPETKYAEAVTLLYEGRTDESIELFRLANSAKKLQRSPKDLPQDAVSCLMYVAALGIRRSEADVAELSRIHSSALPSSCRPVSAIACFLKDSRQYVSPDVKFMLNSSGALERSLAAIAARLMGIDATPEPSACAILQREIDAMYETGRTSAWPYPPVMGRIRIRQKWELQIEELIASCADRTENREERVYYLARPRSEEVEPRLQGRLKNGGWGKGKALSGYRWQDGDFPMDEVDKAVHAAWAKGSHGVQPKLKDVLPCCKGTDKLYVEHGYLDWHTVDVREEKPYISTERTGDGRIKFISNVSDGESYQWSKDLSTVTYWPFEGRSRNLFDMVMKLGTVPAEAEPMLETLFQSLRGKVEVRSEIRGGVQFEKVDGNSRLYLRITPDAGGFALSMLVRPLDGDDTHFQAGSGSESFVGTVGENSYEVVRNLRAERKSRKHLLEMLESAHLCFSQEEPLFLLPQGVLSVMDFAGNNPEKYAVEWPEGETLSLREPKSSDWNISAVGKGGWFELEGDLRISEEEVITAARLMELIGATDRYICLGDGQYLKLSDRIRSQLLRLSDISQENRGRLVVPEMAMGVMEDSLDDVLEVRGRESLEERNRRMKEAAQMDFRIPDALVATLRPYQEDGYRWMMSLAHWGGGACLADDMGLGKTVQTIAFLLSKASEGPQLVVAPASVVSNWGRELARFSPTLKVSVLGDCPDRKAAIVGLGSGSVMLTTYGLMVSESEQVTSVQWTTVVLDEAHTIKNRDTKMSSAAMKLDASYRIALTGTPVQNHLGELWNLFRFLNPGLLGSYEHFRQKYIADDDSSARDTLKRLVTPFMLRRTKNEVVRELPDKTEITVPVQLSAEEMAVYEVIRREAKAELSAGSQVTVNALAMMTKLRMASCAASLAEKSWKGKCSKLEVLVDKLGAIVEGGNSVLVFSQFTSFLQMACESMKAAGITDYLYLDGATPVRKRQQMVDSFQRGEHRIFLISLKAGGLGLNLTGANYVLHLDPWWNPAIEQQATDRAYRIGQDRKVTVYHLISEGTIEEKILRLHGSKREIADSILEGTSTPGAITPEELLALLENS